MPSIELKELEKFDKRLEEIINKIPEFKRQIHTEAAAMLKRRIDSAINTSLSDSSGHIKNWQEEDTGSGGGYAVIRPKKGAVGADSPGAITNYLEGGHKIRPGGQGKDYRPRIKVPYVSGRHFYAEVRAGIVGDCITLANELADKVKEGIEG